MILPIILLVLVSVVVSLVLFFVSCLLIPAVKTQTKMNENIVFSSIEHDFKKLYENESKVEKTDKKAVVLCSPNKVFEEHDIVSFEKGQSCSLIASSYSSSNFCKFSCIGMGDCKKVCEIHAIEIKNRTAIISEICSGCGKCVKVCPRSVIVMLPRNTSEEIICANHGETLSGCSNFQKEENIEPPHKNYFKIWKSCYKMLNNIK